MKPLRASLLIVATLVLAGCDLLGIESAQAIAERREADGKAVGGACRHAGRALEDCYALNRKADKAAVFAGWREMNDYMRENSIDAVVPQHGADVAAETAARAAAAASAAADGAPPHDAPNRVASPRPHPS